MSNTRVSYNNLFPQQKRLNTQPYISTSNQEKSDGSSIIITPSNRNTRKKKENKGKSNQIDQFQNFSYFTPSNFNNFTNDFDDFTSSLNRNSNLYIKENESDEEASNDKENMYDSKKFLRIEKSKCYEIEKDGEYKRGSMLSKYNDFNADKRNSSFLNNTYMNNNNNINNTNTSVVSNNFDCSMISEYLIKPNKNKQNIQSRQSNISFPGQSFRNKSFSQKRIKSINEIAPEDMIDYDNDNDNEKERMINIQESFIIEKKNNKRLSSRLKLNESIINNDKSSVDERNEEENEDSALNSKNFKRNTLESKRNQYKIEVNTYNSKENLHSIDTEGSENTSNYITTINEYSTPNFPSSNKENSLGFSSKKSYINLKRHVSSENIQKNSIGINKKTPKTASFKNSSISNVNNTNKSTVNDIIEEADEGNEDQTAKKSSKRRENNEERRELEENIKSTRLFELEDKENRNLNKKNKEENRKFHKKEKESPSISISQSIIRQKDSQTSMNSTINYLNLNNLNNEYINKRPVAEYNLNGNNKDKYYLSSGNKKYHTLNTETDRDDIDLYTDLYINEGKNHGFHQENHQKYSNNHHFPMRKVSFLDENERISNFSQRNTVQSIANMLKNENNQRKIFKDEKINENNKESLSFQSKSQVFNKNNESNDISRRSYIKLNENFRQLSEIPKALLSNNENIDNYSQIEGMTSKIKNENYKLTLQSTNTNKSTIFNENEQGSESSRDDYTYNKVPITKEYAALYKSPDEKDDFTIKVNKKYIFSMNPIEKSSTIDVVTSNTNENNKKGGVIELFNNILLKIDNIKNQKSSRRFNPSPIKDGNSKENKEKPDLNSKIDKENKGNSHLKNRQVKNEDEAGKNKKILIKKKKSYVKSIKLIQRAYRNYINRQNFNYESELYKKIVLIQSNFKGFYLRKTLWEMINKYESQRNLQVLYKNSMINIFSSLRLFTHKYSAILFIQSSIRQWLERNKEYKARRVFDGVSILKKLIQKTYFSFFNKMETYIDYISNEETRAVEYIEYIDRLISNRYAYYKYFFMGLFKKYQHDKGGKYVRKTRKISCLTKENMKRLGNLIVDCDFLSKMFIKQLYFIEWYEKSQKLRILYEKTHGLYGKYNQNSQKNIKSNSKILEINQYSNNLSQGIHIIYRIFLNKSREAFKKMILFKKQENLIKNYNSNLTFKPYNIKKLSSNMSFSLNHLLFNYLLILLKNFNKKLYVKDLINVFLYIKISVLSKNNVVSSKSLIEIKIKDKIFDVLYKKPNLLYSSSGASLKLKEKNKQKTNDKLVGFNISIPSAGCSTLNVGCQLKGSRSKSKSSNRRSFYRTIKRNTRK